MKNLMSFVIVLLGCALTVAASGRQQAAPPPSDLTGEGRAVVELLVREDFAGASKNFDAQMKEALSPAKLAAGWKALISQVGAFKRIVGVKMEKTPRADVAVVTCEFEKSGINIHLSFDAERRVAGLFFMPASLSKEAYRAPAYVNPAAFQEREVRVGTGEWAVPGTLTLPTVGRAPFPAVVLVHGSGSHDRDETIGVNKPFRDLAQGLASRGIAVLRYDKRTHTHGAKLMGGAADTFTVKEEVIDDALAAAALLRQTEGVNPKRIFLLGHSLGAMLAPRIARADARLAGLILLAAPSRPLEDVIVAQFTHLFSADGTISGEEQAQLERIKEQVARLKSPQLSAETPAASLPFGLPARYWLSVRNYHPAAEARTLKLPMLVMQGERDYQVTFGEDFAGWRALSPSKRVELKSYPKLNHLFFEGEGRMSTPAEYARTGNIPAYVVEDIALWVKRHSG